ncbi:MAG: DUF418 domain-containing protein [Ferruginibacter sp.]
MTDTAAPVLQKERIDIIDSLRGFAILGILLMNIPGFAYAVMGHDPSVKNEFGTINYYIWHFVEWIPDGTQRALFSMLFGAGILLFISGKEKQQTGVAAADYFFRRQLWLIVFGLVNIYIFLWEGDILFDYGCYGLIMFVLRLWEPKKLIIAAVVCMALMIARENRDLYLDKKTIARGEAVEKIDTTVTKLTADQQEYLGAMQEIRDAGKPENKIKKMEKINRRMQGSYEEVYETSTDRYLSHFLTYTYFSIWDVLSFMMLGMAFFKLGILTGKAPVKLYALMCVAGLGLGILVSYYQLQPGIDAKFSRFEYIKNVKVSFYDLGRVLRTLGILGFLMLLYKSNVFKWLFSLMRPVGQMAFTNYLTQSIMGTIIFTGIGFGYFGKLQRYEVYMIVLGIWLLQIVWSHIWLRYFQYGPFEWIWRQLTYWKKLPLKKQAV